MMVFSGSLLPFFFFVIAEFMAMHKTTTSATLPTSSNPAPNHTSPVDCDFEESFCHWEVDTDPYRKKWTRKSKTARSTGVYGNDPLADHTLGNVYGHYVGLNNRYARSKGASNMTSPSVVIPEKGICFQFWYYMFGASVPSLKVFITPTQTTGNAESRVVWTSSGSQGINWKRSRLHIQDVQGEAYINIQAEYDKYSSIALDDLSMNYGHCPPSNLCDFEDDNLCSYTQEKSDDFDWSLSTPDSRAKQEGPKTDHTYETAAGHYAFINASIAQFAGKKASLESNPFPATTHSCLSFWYDMEGNSMGTLSVRVKSSSVTGNKNKNPRPIWTKTGDKEGGWLLANVDVSSAVEYNIVFDGIVGHSIQNTMMAIDDIRVRQGLCPEPNSCDFEEHTCMWRNNRQGDDADWEIVPTSFASGVGPKFDHTLYTSAGHYLYFDTRKLSRGDVAKISSPAFEKGKTYCLHFWYYINTDANFTIVIQEVNTNTENNLRLNTTHMNEKSWSVVRDTIGPFLNDFNVVFTGTMSVYQKFHGSIAVDDVSIQKGSCGTTPLPTQTKNAFRCPDGNFLSQREVCDFNEDCAGGDEELQCGYDCDFEKGTSCGWVASHYKYAAWIIQNGTRSEQEGGPSLDNTLNTVDGHFLYLTGNSNVFVHSPIFQKSAPSCEMVFALFYHNVPRSGLYIRKIVKDETIILFIPGSQNDHGPKWQHVIIPIGQSEVPFKIRFNGVGYRKASVAVDDIYFRNCEFPQPHVSCTDTNTFHCKNKGCVHPATVCNYLDDCGDGSDEAWEICQHYNRCDFESGMCEWSQATNGDDFDWILSDSVRSSWRPHADHTTSLQYGHYMSIKNTLYKRLPGDRAWLLSPVLKPTSHCTLTLYVFFDEYPSEQFSIYTRSEIGGPLTELVTKVGGGILAWTTVHLQFKSSIDFQIIIEGRFVLDGKGTMSVDDFVLSPGCNTSSKSLPLFTNLKPPTTPSPCGDIGKWQCADGSQCIYRFELCDFVTQCTDGSDEKDCGTCDFETSSCGWFDKTRGRYIWDRVNTSSNDIQGKPKTDHTHAGESIGSFMFIHSRGFGYTRPVLFESPVFGSTESDCFIRFYYYVPNSTGTLRLRLYPKDITSYEDGVSGVRLWYKSFVKKWTRATVSIGSRSAGFRLVFRYTFSREPGEKEQSIAAIDDISFSSECGMGRPSAVCKIGEFMCQQSKECKPLTARCDFAKDCFNGEDEKDCEKYLMTDFEQGVNENIFENDLRDINLYWIKTQPSSSSDEYAPDRDHTFGNETGHYMYIERGESSSTFAVARLKGPVILANKEGTCHMRLFYHLNGNYSNAINVYTENTEGGVLKRVWSVNNEEGNEWKRVDIQLDEFKPFRVIIEGVRDTDYRGDIGIDDVSFTPQCVKSSHSLPAYFPAPRHGSCKKDLEFTCDGKCVSVSKWCDFKVDCADKMDEITCPPQCDFEHGMCGWKNPSPRYSADWEIEQIKTGVDHKPGTSKGFVLKTTEGSTGRRYNVKAYLESHFFRASSYNCSFSFWMKKRGSNLKLDFKIRSFGVEEDFFSETIKKDNQEVWLHKTVMIPPCQKDFQLVLIFESRYRSNTDYLLLDDFSFNDCSVAPATERCKPGEFQCNNGVCILEDGLCDLVSDCCDDSDETVDVCHKYRKNTFENGMGGWKKKVGITTWKRQKAKPYLDHTFSSPDGHWISATCSKKTISVHEMPLPNEICVMRFWYAFLGTNGNITVFAKPFLGETRSVASFSAFSGIKAEWSIAEVKIDMHERYLLTLEGICNGYRSTIYIDDITFSPSCGFAPSKYLPPTSTPVTTKKTTIFDPCPNPDQFKCISDGDCIWKSQVCNFNIDCGDKSDEIGCNTISTCDFDVDLCGWQETEPDSLDWVRGSSTDVADNHGPRFDASGSSGNYVYIQNTNKGNLQTQIASLRSKDFPSAAAGCALEFYFFHLGSNPGTLLLKVIYGPKKEGVLWETSKKSDSWVKVIIGVGRRNSTFSLAFTRSPDSGPFTGLMAIDKIHFSSSCMELSVVDTNCPNEDLMFRCGRGACILKSQLCDGQDDCGDGSDESRQQCKGYSREDFETPTLPLGRLTQSINDELDWSVWNSSMSIPIGLLGVDHSSGLPQGHYLYVTGSPKMKKTDSARLQSNPFKATTSGNSCEVRFFVLLPSELQSVQVGYRAYNSNDSVSYENTNVNIFGSYWQHVAFTFENVSRPFVIVIKASPGHPEGSLAIDDVTFGPHCRPTDSSLHNAESTDDDSDGEWKTAVGVVIGLLGVVSLVAGGIFYLFRTGKIDGIRIRFERFVEEKSGRYDSSGSHDNPVYYDGRAVVNVQK